MRCRDEGDTHASMDGSSLAASWQAHGQRQRTASCAVLCFACSIAHEMTDLRSSLRFLSP